MHLCRLSTNNGGSTRREISRLLTKDKFMVDLANAPQVSCTAEELEAQSLVEIRQYFKSYERLKNKTVERVTRLQRPAPPVALYLHFVTQSVALWRLRRHVGEVGQ